jgi:hypothetical protein
MGKFPESTLKKRLSLVLFSIKSFFAFSGAKTAYKSDGQSIRGFFFGPQLGRGKQ